ncbi:MAG: glycosyltransferase [Monoglobales bacterium]
MKRILQVYPQLNNAGTEMVIMNWYRNIDRHKLQFDFLVQKNGELDSIVNKMGARIFCIPKTRDYENQVCKFLKQHKEYETVHTHTHKEMGEVLSAARKAGVKCRIAHSHNSRTDLPKLFKLYKLISSRKIEKNATHMFACSNEAAMWLFPTRYRECRVINNAIDTEKFLFDENVRQRIRSALNIPQDAKVICHVGRFAEEKNHVRIISLLNQMTEKDESIYALLIGVGPDLENIKAMSNSERIKFLGNRTDVPDMMSAADVFLFPSLYEGLGIVAVEAQANGMKCIASTGVPKAADIGVGLFERISNSEEDWVWIDRLYKAFDTDLEKRRALSEKAKDSGYNIKNIAKEIEDFYLG